MTDDQSRLEALEAMPIDDADGRALATLRRIYEVGDPVPPSLLERVKFAITLDDLEAEVARLQREGAGDLVAARSEGVLKAQTVTFTSETLTTMVTITPLPGGGVRIDGWATPGSGLGVELRVGDTTMRTTADQDGRFVFEQVANGLAQFILRPSSGSGSGSASGGASGGGGDGGDGAVVTPAIEL
jgi:uncharacterized membrane protein YgcG